MIVIHVHQLVAISLFHVYLSNLACVGTPFQSESKFHVLLESLDMNTIADRMFQFHADQSFTINCHFELSLGSVPSDAQLFVQYRAYIGFQYSSYSHVKALTVDSGGYDHVGLKSHSLCQVFQSFQSFHGVPTQSLPGFHSTGITTVPHSGHGSPSAQSFTSSIQYGLSPGSSADVAGLSLFVRIQLEPTQSVSGCLTISMY